MTNQEIAIILARITYKTWSLRVTDLGTPNPSIQWVFEGPCAKTGKMDIQFCRKHRLSQYMTPGEIVQTAFAAALQAEEHECREFFAYNGHRIFNPHLSLSALVERCNDEEARNPNVKQTPDSGGGWHSTMQGLVE